MADPEPHTPAQPDPGAGGLADSDQSGAGYGNHMPTDPQERQEDDEAI